MQVVHDAARNLSLVERLRATLGDLLECPREIGVLERVAGMQRLATTKEQRATSLVFEEVLPLRGERRREPFADDVSLTGRTNGGGEDLFPCHLSAPPALPSEMHRGGGARDVGEHGAIVREASTTHEARVVEPRILRHA